MIKLTENARKELEAFFADKPKSGIRIYMAPGGWRGPRLALALDEPAQDDLTEEVDAFKFCMSADLAKSVGGVSIDLTYMGFVVEPEVPLASEGSGCSSCGTGGSCGI